MTKRSVPFLLIVAALFLGLGSFSKPLSLKAKRSSIGFSDGHSTTLSKGTGFSDGHSAMLASSKGFSDGH